MQELRLVAVSEDGTYLVLAVDGRGGRFTLPVDDRLRAAIRGNFSRLGRYEIEVESPLRPKEIQARIRAGETAEEIASTAGIPVERVRWFEGPVLQERGYMAEQAQQIAVRLPGESVAGPRLGDLVAERLADLGVPADEIDWDSRRRDDGIWRVRLGFILSGVAHHAEWLFDTRRRHITPGNDEAMRLSTADLDPLISEPAAEPADHVEPVEAPSPDVVTPLVPRPKLQPVEPPAERPVEEEAPPARAVGGGDPRETGRAAGEPTRTASETTRTVSETGRAAANETGRAAGETGRAAANETGRAAGETGRAAASETGRAAASETGRAAAGQTGRGGEGEPRRATAGEPSRATASESRQVTARESKRPAPKDRGRPAGAPSMPASSSTAVPPAPAEPSSTAVPAAANDGPPPAQSAASAEEERRQAPSKRSASRKSGRGRRSSVPSWDEIMFGAKRDD